MLTSSLRMLTTEYVVSPGSKAAKRKVPLWGRGLLTRAISAIREASQRHAEREIARFIASHGGELTDDLEREISRRFGRPAGEVR